MADETVMLAVSYDEEAVTFPVEVSVKLDGVAAEFTKTPNGWVCHSRQGKPLPSTGFIIKFLNKHADWCPDGLRVIGELTVVGLPVFKEAAGVIRRKEADPRIVLNVYDICHPLDDIGSYEARVKMMTHFIKKTGGTGVKDSRCEAENVTWSVLRRVPVVGIRNTIEQLEQDFRSLPKLMEATPMFEGFMIRCLQGEDSKFNRGKRSRNMMRYKPKPTMDLRVVSFEEATANKAMRFLGESFSEGDGLRAVGRINVEYLAVIEDEPNMYTRPIIIGVGPGTLTHLERRALWEMYGADGEAKLAQNILIAEVEYMKDDNYEALRQPVFKRWRPDKSEASQEA